MGIGFSGPAKSNATLKKMLSCSCPTTTVHPGPPGAACHPWANSGKRCLRGLQPQDPISLGAASPGPAAASCHEPGVAALAPAARGVNLMTHSRGRRSTLCSSHASPAAERPRCSPHAFPCAARPLGGALIRHGGYPRCPRPGCLGRPSARWRATVVRITTEAGEDTVNWE